MNRFQKPTFGQNGEYHPPNGMVVGKSVRETSNTFALLKKQMVNKK